MPQFRRLRRHLRMLARKNLEENEPEYVQRFLEEFQRTNDLERAHEVARPLLPSEDPPPDGSWEEFRNPLFELLTLAFDVELLQDKTRRALSLLKTPNPELGQDWNAGAWTIYHFDQWTFQAYAWLERIDNLVKGICRMIIRPVSADWVVIEKRLCGDVMALKDGLRDIRDPLTHGGGGGVTGPEEDRAWEPSLLLVEDMELVSLAMYAPQGEFAQRWHERLLEVSARILTASENIYQQLNEKIIPAA